MTTIATHTPPFHPDDLFAVALMRKACAEKGESCRVIWTRDPKVLATADIVVDVGGIHDPKKLRFDHHQDRNAEKAATGLVADFIRSEMGMIDALRIIEPLVTKIDAADLGKEPYELSSRLAAFNATWEELDGTGTQESNRAFEEVLGLIDSGLDAVAKDPSHPGLEHFLLNHPRVKARELEVKAAVERGQNFFIKEAMGSQDGVAIVFPGIAFEPLFTAAYLKDKNTDPEAAKALKKIDYIAFPTLQGGWAAVAAPTPNDPFAQKKPFPETWRGKRGIELVEAIAKTAGQPIPTPKEGLEKAEEYFCHGAGFFFTAPDKAIFDLGMKLANAPRKEPLSPKKNPSESLEA